MSTITKEIKEKLIAKHGKDNLRLIEVPTNEIETEFLEILVLVPDREIFSQYMKYIDVNFKKAADILIKATVLTSKEIILADDDLANSAAIAITELIEIRKSRVKKL